MTKIGRCRMGMVAAAVSVIAVLGQQAPVAGAPAGAAAPAAPTAVSGYEPQCDFWNSLYYSDLKGVAAWVAVPSSTPGSSSIFRGQSCRVGNALLTMQWDGNLVLYDQYARARWATNTWGQGGVRATMQIDGNFVVYDANDRPLWASNTYWHTDYVLAIQGDGNMVIYRSFNEPNVPAWWVPVWATNTWS
jgi:hypothetical protein